MESGIHAHSRTVEVSPHCYSGTLQGVRLQGGFKVIGNGTDVGRTMMNLLCVSGGVSPSPALPGPSSPLGSPPPSQAKTHALAGNVAMETVRNRMAGLHKALEVPPHSVGKPNSREAAG
jgi:hypothetical protein